MSDRQNEDFCRGYQAGLLFATKALQGRHAKIWPGFMRNSTCGAILLGVGRIINAEFKRNSDSGEERGQP